MPTIIQLPNRPLVTIEDVFDRNKYNLRDAAKQSSKWFAQQAVLLKKQGYTSKRVLSGVTGNWEQYPVPGKMYMYMYDAKHKATLPYWDKFPLVFPFKMTKDGFIGINLHYLPYQYRIKILDDLVGVKLRKNSKHHTLQLSWQLISGYARYKPLEPCVHRYLFNQLRSGLRLIDSADWATAALLPVQQFVGASTTHVHKESIRKGMM